MSDFGAVSLFDGERPHVRTKVTDDGQLVTDASGSSVRPIASNGVTTTKGAAGTSSTELIDVDDNRTQILIQNTSDANTIHIALGTDDADANDLAIPPGGTFTFPPGVTYTGAIQVIASDVDTNYVVLEFFGGDAS